MRKLIKYLKPFSILLIISVALLFIQAMADLALPNYMSNIVNVGIQQSGIEHSTPEAIRENKMDKLFFFMDSEEKELVLSNYNLISINDNQYSDYADKYPNLNQEAIYILKNLDDNELLEMDIIMAKALLSSTEMIDSLTKQVEIMGESSLIQSGAMLLKANYEDLGVDIGIVQRNYIMKIGGIMLLITLIGAASSITVGFLAAKISAGFARNIRKKLFTKVSSFTNTEMDKFSTSSLITRSTNDITQIQTLMVFLIRLIFYAPILGIGGIFFALNKSSSMSWIIALAVIVLIGIIILLFSIVMPKFKLVQKLVDKLNLVTRENLSGMLVIRAFNNQKFEEERFEKANVDLTKTNLFVNRVMVVMMPFMMLIMNGVNLLIVWVGAHQIANSAMQVGDMMAFMQYAMQIIMAFLMLSAMFIMVPRASVSANRIAEVLETKPVINDPKELKHFDSFAKGTVEFKNVSFRYPGASEDMLKNISFKAEAGKITAIIGTTGSGKTTLVNLVPRFYDVTNGEVLINGIDVREVSQYELREQIGYVPQKALLFSGTVESNLKYTDENTSDTEIIKAAKIAQAIEFIEDKTEGFNSNISQAGGNLSGGQKQRLSIARALVKKPKIYIFDDSFSALDFKTDASLRKALNENISESTILLVAQRISTIKNAEQIIVLKEGKIDGIGTHDNLMKTCETYKAIALSQLSKEELS